MTDSATYDRQRAICVAIVTELTAHPEFLSSAISAITSGQANALALANKRADERDRAWLLTLCLWNGQKLTLRMREMLESALVPLLSDNGAKCAAEKEALERVLTRQS